MIRNIIVEGADQQGKSTVCDMLHGLLNWPVEHFNLTIPKEFDFHGSYILPENSISDRSYLSEIVYSSIRGCESRVVKKELLEERMKCRCTLLILCDRKENYTHSNRDEYLSESQILRARAVYRDVFEEVRMVKTKVDPSYGLDWLKSYVRVSVKW